MATDDESEMEPEDLYSQVNHADPQRSSWERTGGGAVGGVRYLAHPRGPVSGETDISRGNLAEGSRSFTSSD